MSTGFTVMSPLGDGVEWLLAFHAQRDLLLSDWGRGSFSQLHTALRDTERSRESKLLWETPHEAEKVRQTHWLHRLSLKMLLGHEALIWEQLLVSYRGVRWCGLVVSE